MKESNAVILSNTLIARDVWKMELKTDLAVLARPGQFVEIALTGFFLRRPISVSDTDGDVMTIVYKVMGNGTDAMTGLKPGETLNLFGPLGQGFPVLEGKEAVLLLGGGVGVPPLLKTAKAWLAKGKKVDVALGFNNAADVFYLDAFSQLGIDAAVATMDGSAGVKGTVLDAVAARGIETDFVMACGPLPMLRAISQKYTDGYVSLEARMGCGIGVCMGCVVHDAKGTALRVCKNGPVFPIGRVVF